MENSKEKGNIKLVTIFTLETLKMEKNKEKELCKKQILKNQEAKEKNQ